MLHIVANVFIVGVPRVKMTKQEVMISAPDFTQRDQVVGVKFQVRMKMEGFDMMDLQLFAFVAASHACRFAESMLLCHSGPL